MKRKQRKLDQVPFPVSFFWLLLKISYSFCFVHGSPCFVESSDSDTTRKLYSEVLVLLVMLCVFVNSMPFVGVPLILLDYFGFVHEPLLLVVQSSESDSDRPRKNRKRSRKDETRDEVLVLVVILLFFSFRS